MKNFLGIILLFPLLLAAESLRITDSSRAGSELLRKAALAYSIEKSVDIRIDRMSANQAKRLIPQSHVDIAVFEESDIPESLKESSSVFLDREVLVIYVNSANQISGLSSRDAAKIFSAIRPRWSEYGGAARTIHRIKLKDSAEFSGLDRDIFKSAAAPEVAGVERSEDMILLAGADPDAMGFGNLRNYGSSVRVLAIDGALPTDKNVKNKRYPLVRSYRLFIVKTSAAAVDFVEFLKKNFL